MALKDGDRVIIKIVDPTTELYRTLRRSGWRPVDVQSDGTVVLLQPLDPDQEARQ